MRKVSMTTTDYREGLITDVNVRHPYYLHVCDVSYTHTLSPKYVITLLHFCSFS